MTDKPPRRHNRAWADNTRAERQARRRAALDEIARAVGYDTWRKLETACINGKLSIVAVSEPARGE